MDPLSETTRGPELAIVIPTFNERDNVEELLSRLRKCLDGLRWEVIFVDDDSPDETADLVRSLGTKDHRVRCLQRIGRRGLSSACIEGMLASSAPYIAVMDGDLQHDEALLPQMYSMLSRGGVDLVIGSRHVEGGGIGDWRSNRAFLSRLGAKISRIVIPTELGDPMSGFFSGQGGTLGSQATTPPAVADNGDNNTMSGSSVTVGGSSIQVTSVTVWINAAQSAPNNQFQVAIYTDNGGKPGSLVASSGSQTVTGNSWNTVSLPATLNANTTYWLLYNTNSTNIDDNAMSEEASSSQNSWYYSGQTFGSWPASARSGHVESPQQAYSMYVTYQ